MKYKVCTAENCPHAGQPQPITAFHRNKTCADGYSSQCKYCKLAAGRRRYAERGRDGRNVPDPHVRWSEGTPKSKIFSGSVREGLERVAASLKAFEAEEAEKK